jgi:hypothetical protein
MGYTALNVTAPHATAYDSDYPTRSTENYAHNLHTILQDMEDAGGTWTLSDGLTNNTTRDSYLADWMGMIEDVWDYAEGAIDTYRATGTPTLSKPTVSTIAKPVMGSYEKLNRKSFDLWISCHKVMWAIYYMWKTEDDPLLLKEKLQELLVAWPLTDTEVILNEEGGQSLHVHPAWKNVDI